MRSRLLFLMLLATFLPSCLVEQRCNNDGDCPGGKVCGLDGTCEYQCSEDDDCGEGFRCEARRCVPDGTTPITCPDDMVPIANVFCVDRYEASRPDATMDSPGVESGLAQSVEGVFPWRVGDDNETATIACELAGKRLCTPFEWELACRGPEQTVYAYGKTYDTQVCNGIDTWGALGSHLDVTGAFSGCVNDYGVYDMNGNLWEHTAEGSGETVRGGAFNCIDSRTLHRCDYVPRSWVPSALGFRCCYTPPGVDPITPDVVTPDAGSSEQDGSSGCLDVPNGDIVVECVIDDDCTDVLAPIPDCQRAACELPAGNCVLLPVQDGLDCDDGNPCTEGDTCAEGVCQPGETPTGCDDDNLCTDDSCDPATGCTHVANDLPCDDNDPCTGTDESPDHCAEGQCQAGANLPSCLCEDDDDCLALEDGDMCNGTLFCDLTVETSYCRLRPDSIVTCPDLENSCQENICDPVTGDCHIVPRPDGADCDDRNPCTEGDHCSSGQCEPGDEYVCACPTDMVQVGDSHCVDRYEASLPDATSGSMGTRPSEEGPYPAVSSISGVIPWYPVSWAQGVGACEAAGKRVCTIEEWSMSCRGSNDTEYIYGNDYSADICNGIDAFCLCDDVCAEQPVCPFPHCRSTCGAYFRIVPTAAFADCLDEYGAYDVNGNVWELVDMGDEQAHYKGGAFNCGDSERLHACSYTASNGVSAKGLRCCKDLDEGRTRAK